MSAKKEPGTAVGQRPGLSTRSIRRINRCTHRSGRHPKRNAGQAAGAATANPPPGPARINLNSNSGRRWRRRRNERPMPLFDAPRQSPPIELPHRGVPTSVAAAKAAAPRARSQRQVVLNSITAHGSYGATLDELVVELGTAINVISPSVWELRKTQIVADSGRRRPTRTSSPAIVWIRSTLFHGAAGCQPVD